MVGCICNPNLGRWRSAKPWCSPTSLSSLLRLVKILPQSGGGEVGRWGMTPEALLPFPILPEHTCTYTYTHVLTHMWTRAHTIITISLAHIGISLNKDPNECHSHLLSLLCASVTTSIFVYSCLFLSVEKPDYLSDEFPSIWILVNCIHVVLLVTFLWFLHPLLFLKSSRSFVLFPSLACPCLANGCHVSLPQEVMFIGDFFCTETLIHIHELKRGYTMVITTFCCSLFICGIHNSWKEIPFHLNFV